MKKLFSFIALTLMMVGMYAQSWGTVPDGLYNHETVVYATLTSNLPDPSQVKIGAFIDGKCRASADPQTSPNGWLYTIRVKGDLTADNGNTIFFKVFDGTTGFEYLLDNTITFDGETHGTPPSTNAINMTLTAPTSYSLNFTEAEVGESYILREYVTATPSGAKLPLNMSWWMSPDDPTKVTLVGDTLTGVAPATGITLTMTDTCGIAKANCVFDVKLYATSINLPNTEVLVTKNDVAAMQTFMQAGTAYELLPAGAEDAVSWEVDPTADATILTWNPAGYYNPVKGGTTRIRPYVTKKDNSKLYPDGWITVTVVVPVNAIIIDYSKYGGSFDVNVGDTHIYERMAKLITVLPEDATDKTWSISMDAPGAINLTGPTTLSAETGGMSVVKVTANGVSVEPIQADVIVNVVDPVTTVSATNNNIYVVLTDGNPESIEDEVHNNVTLTTASGFAPSTLYYGDIALSGTSVTATSEELTSEGILGHFDAVSAGTTTITVTVRWPDYDAWGITSETLPIMESSAQFNIVVTEGSTLMGFDVAVTNAVAGKTGTLTLTPQPSNATFDVNNIVVTLSNGLEEAWGSLLNATMSSATTSQIVYEFTSTIPSMVSVLVTNSGVNVPLNDPTSAEPNTFNSFEIGYPLDLNAGWQWRSNPFGIITPGEFGSVFTDQLIEIRTQNDLLYNDPSWGPYGSLMSTAGILQGQCYKLKMGATTESVIYASSVTGDSQMFGTVNSDGSLSITLKPGWNWIGSPYLFNRQLTTLFSAYSSQLDGAVIVGKTGSAELSYGIWNGDLTVLKSGEGYIIKNPGTEDVVITFATEDTMTPAHEGTAAGVRSQHLQHVWEYDHTRFMNNMTMVAELEDAAHPEQYSIGAFVGDECRGEGIVSNGKLFITVHCDLNEYVTFKLYNTLTNEFFDVEEGLKAQTRVGSLKAPFRMHGKALTDGIHSVNGSNSSTETYDLSGRRTSNQQRGISLRRMADGSVRKVVVK